MFLLSSPPGFIYLLGPFLNIICHSPGGIIKQLQILGAITLTSSTFCLEPGTNSLKTWLCSIHFPARPFSLIWDCHRMGYLIGDSPAIFPVWLWNQLQSDQEVILSIQKHFWVSEVRKRAQPLKPLPCCFFINYRSPFVTLCDFALRANTALRK